MLFALLFVCCLLFVRLSMLFLLCTTCFGVLCSVFCCFCLLLFVVSGAVVCLLSLVCRTKPYTQKTTKVMNSTVPGMEGSADVDTGAIINGTTCRISAFLTCTYARVSRLALSC